MKKRFFYLSLFSALFATSLFMAACNDDDPPGGDPDEPTGLPAEKPTTDFVEHTYNDKVVFLDSDDHLAPYFKKRFGQLETEITKDTRVVVMDNALAGNFLANAERLKQLKEVWTNNGVLIFLTPEDNTFKLHHLLTTGRELSASESEANKQDGSNKLLVFAVKGNGHSFFYADPRTQLKTYVTTNKNTGEVTTEDKVFNYELNDYQWGQVAEKACEWLVKNMTGEHNTPHKSLVRNTSDYIFNSILYTYYCGITVYHDLVSDVGHGTSPAPTYTDNAKYEFAVTPTFNRQMECDVYDVALSQDYTGSETYVKNVVTRKDAAYKYKYSGGNYAGPTVETFLLNDQNPDGFPQGIVDLHAPAPINEPEKYIVTHDPGSLSIGASVTGGISAAGPTADIGFSVQGTLPSTTKTEIQSAMPVSYAREAGKAIWEYIQDQDLYDFHGGRNATYLDPPGISLNLCQTDQAVTFSLKNSKELGHSPVKLYTKMNYKTYHETDSPWDWYIRICNHSFSMKFTLPLTMRYFEKYTPYRYSSSSPADGLAWQNLEAMLMENVYYKSLKDETLEVGGCTQEDMENNAEEIWEKTIDSLINQYQGTDTKHEYIIAMADSKGNKQKNGLHIKNGVWVKIAMF
ncbi:MAG: hypothetical protein J6C15_07430 [Bacteroidaceae bacterium]|nr:hypothetical protein [Bacteroidaceae bacterium]